MPESSTDQDLFRPQPVGIFPLPAGLLLLPATLDPQPGKDLLRGDTGRTLPAEWEFFSLALGGDLDRAWHAVKNIPDPLRSYNRFVLRPDAHEYARLRGLFRGELATLLEVAAFSLGLTDETPDGTELDGELLAVALAAKATAAQEAGDAASGRHWLTKASEAAEGVSPVLAGQLLGQLASTLGDPEMYARAITLVGDTPLHRLRAELWLGRGMACQSRGQGQRGLMLEAIRSYQEGLRCLTREDDAALYAQAHNNLGLAYLTTPAAAASDALRMAMAVQSFREALQAFTPDTHPVQWASTQLNLANALQYLPSAHPQANLVQAVELYEAVLAVRTLELDPVGHARVLTNQANALAHLGMFSPALEKLATAHKIFGRHEEQELDAGVMELVAGIHERLAQKSATAGGTVDGSP